jgi:hypothetical protein
MLYCFVTFHSVYHLSNEGFAGREGVENLLGMEGSSEKIDFLRREQSVNYMCQLSLKL